MKINIKQKFELVSKLETLVDNIKEHEESSIICSKALHEFKSNITSSSISRFISVLEKYSWISEVESFVASYKTFIAENRLGINLESILTSLEESAHRSTYESAITEISSIITLNENEIKSQLYKLKSYSYIPALRSFIDLYEKQEFAVTKSFFAEVEKHHVSPVMVTESGYVFNLNGKNYEVNSSITEFNEFTGTLTSEYKYALSAISKFTINENEFVLETAKGFIKIIATEEGANKFFIGENEFFGKDAIKTAIGVTGVVEYFDSTTKAVIDFMYENAKVYSNIEIVKNIKAANENMKLSFIKLANNDIYLNKVNVFERKNELIQITATNYGEIAEAFVKEFKLDITPVLENMKVNLNAIEFTRLVESIDLSTFAEDHTTAFISIDESTKFYNSLSDNDKLDCAKSFDVLESISKKVNDAKVLYLIEAKSKFINEDLDGKEEILALLTSELSECIK